MDCVFATNFTRLEELYGSSLQLFLKSGEDEKKYSFSGYYNFCAVASTAAACKEFCKVECVQVERTKNSPEYQFQQVVKGKGNTLQYQPKIDVFPSPQNDKFYACPKKKSKMLGKVTASFVFTLFPWYEALPMILAACLLILGLVLWICYCCICFGCWCGERKGAKRK